MNSKLLIVQNNVFFSFQVKKKIVFFILTAHSVMILTLIFLFLCSNYCGCVQIQLTILSIQSTPEFTYDDFG